MVDVGDDSDVAKLHERALLATNVRTERGADVVSSNGVTGIRRRAIRNSAQPIDCAVQYTKGRRKGRGGAARPATSLEPAASEVAGPPRMFAGEAQQQHDDSCCDPKPKQPAAPADMGRRVWSGRRIAPPKRDQPDIGPLISGQIIGKHDGAAQSGAAFEEGQTALLA